MRILRKVCFKCFSSYFIFSFCELSPRFCCYLCLLYLLNCWNYFPSWSLQVVFHFTLWLFSSFANNSIVSDDDAAEMEAYIRAQAEAQMKMGKAKPINNEVYKIKKNASSLSRKYNIQIYFLFIRIIKFSFCMLYPQAALDQRREEISLVDRKGKPLGWVERLDMTPPDVTEPVASFIPNPQDDLQRETKLYVTFHSFFFRYFYSLCTIF